MIRSKDCRVITPKNIRKTIYFDECWKIKKKQRLYLLLLRVQNLGRRGPIRDIIEIKENFENFIKKCIAAFFCK